MKNRIEYLIKKYSFFQFFYRIVVGSFIKFIGFFVRLDKEMILFTGQAGMINDSALSIYNYIRENPEYKSFKLIWGVKNPKLYPDHNVVKIDTLKYFVTALKAKYWVATVNIERGLNFKKRKTVYLLTWHGIPIKTIGNAAKGRKDYNFSKINYFVVSSEYEVPIYIRDFKVKEKSIIRTGMPRNDDLYHKKSKGELRKIKKNLGIDIDKKIILYAPTWRESTDYGKNYNIDIPVNFKKWEEELGDEYVLLLRAHPYTKDILNVQFNNFIIDASNYPNINNLLQICDVLITDYSAIFFDALPLSIRILLFPYDLEEYKKNRGIYLNYNEVFKELICIDENDIIDKIKTEEAYDYSILSKFKNEYLTYGGNATQECVELLFREERK